MSYVGKYLVEGSGAHETHVSVVFMRPHFSP